LIFSLPVTRGFATRRLVSEKNPLQRDARPHKNGPMQFRAKQIAPPKEWGTFEDLCHALFKRVWNDRLAPKNGRRGQRS